MSYLGIFGLKLEKRLYCGISHQHSLVFRNRKFRKQEIKILKFGTKIALTGYFSWNFEKLMLYLKSASSNLPTCKVISENKKNFKLGTKNILFRYFWAAI